MELTTYGQRIYRVRKSLNMTMSEFAKVIDVSGKSTVNEWEKDRAAPSDQSLKKIALISSAEENWLKYGSPEEYLYKILYAESFKETELRNKILSYIELKIELPNVLNIPSMDASGNAMKYSVLLKKVKELTDIEISIVIEDNIKDLLSEFENKNDVYSQDILLIKKAITFFSNEAIEQEFTFEGEYRIIEDALKAHTPRSSISPSSYSTFESYLQTLPDSMFDLNEKIDLYYSARLSDVVLDAMIKIKDIKQERLEKIKELDI